MGSDLETAAVKEGAGNSNVAAGSARFEKPTASGLKLARIWAKRLPLDARRTTKKKPRVNARQVADGQLIFGIAVITPSRQSPPRRQVGDRAPRLPGPLSPVPVPLKSHVLSGRHAVAGKGEAVLPLW
jgi:hypothetical protein